MWLSEPPPPDGDVMDIGRVTRTGFPHGVRCATCNKRLRNWYASIPWTDDSNLIICLRCATK